MPTIVVYGPRMGSSFRPHWMLAELGLSYETKELDMRSGEHRKPEFLAINPAGQVPVMVYDGFTLPESAAIVHYLAEKHDQSFFGPMNAELSSCGTTVIADKSGAPKMAFATVEKSAGNLALHFDRDDIKAAYVVGLDGKVLSRASLTQSGHVARFVNAPVSGLYFLKADLASGSSLTQKLNLL